MKSLSFLLLCLVCLSCGKKAVDPVGANCDQWSNQYSSAVNAYASSPTTANCLAFKSALTDLVNKCTVLTPQLRAQYNSEIQALTCN